MAEIIAVTGAITTATRLARESELLGCLSCRAVHTPIALHKGGCSYAVAAPEICLSNILSAASNKRIKIKKIFRERIVDGERVFDDIS